MKEYSIQARPIWGLIHEQLPYLESHSYDIETAKRYWNCVVNVPCSTNLTEDDVRRVCQVLKPC